MRRPFPPGIALACLLLGASAAEAHRLSDGYLRLEARETRLEGRLELSLLDLELVIGLDRDGDGAITWGELRARREELVEYVTARLELSADGAPCSWRPVGLSVDRHGDGAYAVLELAGSCPHVPRAFWVDYRLFFEEDPRHRGLLNLELDGVAQTAVLSPDASRKTFERVGNRGWEQFSDFFREGVWHIWTGFDHLAFLATMLLPAIVVRRDGKWVGAPGLGEPFWNVTKIVTAFSAAHSLTLALSATGTLTLPAAFVEPAIAGSIVLGALNNLYPIVLSRLWAAAFLFGIVHGFGFSSVLRELGLSMGPLLRALFAFNLGVECGQLVIVAAFLGVFIRWRESPGYHRGLKWGSILIGLLGTAWLVERLVRLAA